MGTWGQPELEGVWEEYRYDPLGRRVLVNTRTKGLCTTGTAFRCASATTRMVWAGDQLLWEIRQPSESPGENITSGGSYGTVSYTHAGGIDRPLVITKDGVSILPHQNWRGQFSSGTYANGARSDCPPGSTTNCHPVSWPGYRTTAWHHDAKEPDIRTWWGGLVDGMRDVSGQQYKRNRYYDPATGQFTQPDPIGIAGGLNSYGFAAGDPVSYSDPYGLCPECDEYWLNFAAEGLRQGGVVGTLKAVVGVTASTALEFFGVNDFWRAREQAANGQRRRAAGTFVMAVVGNLPGGKVGRAANLADGMRLQVNDALGAAVDFLGTGYKEVGAGRFLSADGLKQVRMGTSDITGAHGGGPHMNFETLAPNPNKPGKNMVTENLHIYLNGK
jgi:RHS repeat-associated protein